MRIDDKTLESLLSDVESDRVERKESLKGDAPDKLRQAICAFANDLPGHRSSGVAFVGASGGGLPTGLPITDELLRNLSDIKTDGKILPPPSLSVEKRTLFGKDVAVITVLPSDAPPVRFEGRIWIRVGPRRAVANKQDESLLNERRRFRDLPFDIQPVPSSNIADLDRLYYEQEYLPATIARDVLDVNDRSYEQRLASSKMVVAVDEPIPTILGHLVAGIRARDFLPGAYVQFLRLDGGELSSSIIDEEAIDGRLADVIRHVDEKLKAHNMTRVDIKSSDKEQRYPLYPLAALQQLIRNALLHRSYENTNAPVKVNWFNDRIEIWNPGGPFGAVTKETFGLPGYTDYRNPHIAEAMKGLGFVQRFGVGIQTAIAELRLNQNPDPEFQVYDSAVNVIVRR